MTKSRILITNESYQKIKSPQNGYRNWKSEKINNYGEIQTRTYRPVGSISTYSASGSSGSWSEDTSCGILEQARTISRNFDPTPRGQTEGSHEICPDPTQSRTSKEAAQTIAYQRGQAPEPPPENEQSFKRGEEISDPRAKRRVREQGVFCFCQGRRRRRARLSFDQTEPGQIDLRYNVVVYLNASWAFSTVRGALLIFNTSH